MKAKLPRVLLLATVLIASSTDFVSAQSAVIRSNSSGVVVGGSTTNNNSGQDVEVTTKQIVPGTITPGISVQGTSSSTALRNPTAIPGTGLTTPASPPAGNTTVAVPQAPVSGDPPAPMSVAKIKRRAYLARELNALEGGVDAKVALRTGNMFDAGTGQIEEGAQPILGQVSEYLNVVPFKTVTITYHHSPEGSSMETALSRSTTVLSWIQNFGQVKGKTFTIKEPVISADTERVALGIENGGEQFGEFILLHLK